MATTFKQLLNNDVTSTRTLLHEAIPVTGSILSGTYNQGYSTTETNIKNYSHGMFQSVYDYPYLSSSANHILDITVGYASGSSLSASSGRVQQEDKINVYQQMAQMLVGHDVNGNIRPFDKDGDLTGGEKMLDVFFVNFARLLQKDEVKKGTFEIVFGMSGSNDGTLSNTADFTGRNFGKLLSVKDLSGSTQYHVNSPAGEYGILYATSSNNVVANATLENEQVPVGLIYYQAGVAVISGSLFSDVAETGELGLLKNAIGTMALGNPFNKTAGATGFKSVTGSSISGSCDSIRNRIYNLSFNNTTELNSTIYFCRAAHNEFNYSSNPTYLKDSQIRVKTNTLEQPVSYITTVGLYSATNELLAVAKVSEPLKKSPDTELTLRVRLDY
jgi:hypothetical protein